jgi:hypothetical protein
MTVQATIVTSEASATISMVCGVEGGAVEAYPAIMSAIQVK